MNDKKDNQVVYLRIDDIIPNRFQPREVFDATGLEELSESIKEHGVIQPIIVREMGDKYELIAGERRTKASALAGLTTIPAIIRNMDDKEAAKVSLLENLQRKNLSAIEEARTYKRILELDNMTQEDLARNLGRSQPMVANKLRLLSLPDEIQDALMKNQISERHARSLLTVKNKKDQLLFLDKIQKERLTVRELDKELKKYKENDDYEFNIQDNKNELIQEENNLKLEQDSDRELNNKEKNERSFMNNNIGNFGGMGLNDYHSGVNNNMFYNVPNNFNNMPNIDGNMNNNEVNYNNFSEPTPNDVQQNNYFDSMNQPDNNLSNNYNQNTGSSLGSMFDGYNGETTDYQKENNNNNSNLFVSHIREDNLPKVENQFLPNFDSFNNNSDNNESDGSREALNNFNQNNNFNEESYNSNFDMNSNLNYMNSNDNFNQFDNYNMNNNQNNYNLNNFASNNYQDMNSQNNFVPNPYQDMTNQNNMMNNNYGNGNIMNQNNNVDYNNNYNQSMNMFNSQPNNNYFMNDLNNNNSMNNLNNMNNSYGMNNGFDSNFGSNSYNMNGGQINNPMNNYNGNSNNSIPEFNGNMNQNMNMYQPNQGQLFRQPLNIVDVPNNNYMPNNNNNYEENRINVESNPSNEFDNNISQELNDGKDNYMLNTQPLPTEETVTQEEVNLPNEDSEPKIPDIEVIGETSNSIPETSETPIPAEVPEPSQTEPMNDYIKLDPDYTINSTMDAVMELKKTTDRIKQNRIDIETEEIDFDDVYQITIKIKKTDTF